MDVKIISMNFLITFAEAHYSNECFDVDVGENMDCVMEMEKSMLPKIQSLKDVGNNLFRENHIDAAGFHYDKACKLLSSVIGISIDYDVKSYVDLAISLNLNLAACTLKILEYEATKDLCSLILSAFPSNVKALFRRALAFMKLNMFMEALKDLEGALTIEPKNTDILRELNVVKNHFIKNCNGKRSMEETLESGVVRKGKRPIHELRNDGEKIVEERGSLIKDCCSTSCSTSSPVHKDNDLCNTIGLSEQSPLNKGADMFLDTKLEASQNCVGSKPAEFLKKGGHSRLRIPTPIYRKLLAGSEVSFYNKSQLSYMKIRIRKQSNEELRDTPSTPSKKKKKRRRSRKGKTKLDDTTKGKMSPTTSNECVSPVHDFSPHSRHLLKNGSNVNIPSAGCVEIAVHHPFSFSSCPKVRRFSRVKRLTLTNPCQGNQPLRRISPLFTGKIPRSRNVSVSYRRYSSEVKMTGKKRKSATFDMSYSKSPLKKPLIMFNPSPNLVCNSTSVIKAPDLDSQGAATM